MAENRENQLTTYVLLAADRISAVKELATPLASMGTVHATETSTANEAIAALQDQGKRIDVVVIDLEMASGSAVTLTRKIRDARTLGPRNMAILLVGGGVDTPHYRSAARLGVQGHLPRPFTPEKLRSAVRAALAARPIAVAAPAPAKTVVRSEPKPEEKSAAPAKPAAYDSPEPVANKPFMHGLQSVMRRRKPLTADDGFGLEPVVTRQRVRLVQDDTDVPPNGTLVTAVA